MLFRSLSAAELAKVTYTGFDTLYFLDKTGDTNIVVGGGRQFFYNQESFDPTLGDCQTDQVNHQGYRIYFKPLKGDLYFQFWQQLFYQPLFDRIVKIVRGSNWNVFLFVEFDLLGTKGNTYLYTDSMTINGYKYGRVYGTTKYDGSVYVNDTSYKAYMNQTNGVLYLRDQDNNQEYSLIHK